MARIFLSPIEAVAEWIEFLAKDVSPNVLVSRRLKRMESIVAKLQRPGSGDLSKMQDIGGCRVVLPDMDSIRFLQGKELNLNSHGSGRRIKNYIAEPKPDGYRSIHAAAPVRSDGEYEAWRGVRIEAPTRLPKCWPAGGRHAIAHRTFSTLCRFGPCRQSWQEMA